MVSTGMNGVSTGPVAMKGRTRIVNDALHTHEEPRGVDSEKASSFEDFFRAEYARLVRALFLLTGDVAEAEDAVQEAFIRALERWDRVSSMGAPAAYVFTTARNVGRRRHRLRLKHRDAILVDVNPDESEQTNLRMHLFAILKSLPETARDVLILGDWLGFSIEEIATIEGVSVGAARVRLSRARAAFRRTNAKLEELGDE